MIPWCVYLYCEVGKGNGFCRPTSALICDNSGIETCVLCSSLCLQISCHRYVLVNQQADYTATPSFLVSSDQLYWSDNFIQSARRGLEKSRGTCVLKLRSLLFIIAFHWRHQFRAICRCRDFVPYLIINMPDHATIPNKWHIEDWKVKILSHWLKTGWRHKNGRWDLTKCRCPLSDKVGHG